VCKQRLVVFGAQVQRGEVVTCQNCNTDFMLARKGQPRPAQPAGEPGARVVELAP